MSHFCYRCITAFFKSFRLIIPNQISIWFTQELCLGVYTKRILWFSSIRKDSRLFMLFRIPSFPLMPRSAVREHSCATSFTSPSDLWVFRPSQIMIYFLSASSDMSCRTALQKSPSFRVLFRYGVWILPSATRRNAIRLMVPWRMYSNSCSAGLPGRTGLSGYLRSNAWIPVISSVE